MSSRPPPPPLPPSHLVHDVRAVDRHLLPAEGVEELVVVVEVLHGVEALGRLAGGKGGAGRGEAGERGERGELQQLAAARLGGGCAYVLMFLVRGWAS